MVISNEVIVVNKLLERWGRVRRN